MIVPLSFVRQVRHALTHLYDPEALRDHPLIDFLGLADRPNAQAALREALVKEIESLRPEESVPVGCRAWRVYQVLRYRYVQQMDQEQTAYQLGVGVRHLRREQRLAVVTLAEALFAKHAESEDAHAKGPALGDTDGLVARLHEELSWLKDSLETETALIAKVVPAAVELLTPFAAVHGTRLEAPAIPEFPPVAIHPCGLRQAIVSVMASAIRRVPGGKVTLSAERQGEKVALMIVAVAKDSLSTPTEDRASLQTAQALLDMYDGHLEVRERPNMLSFSLVIPLAGTVDVLLIDDNADIAQLFERYFSGSRYRMHAVRGAEQLFEVIRKHTPQIIILDVMNPGVDG